MTATDVLIQAMESLEPKDIDAVLVVLVSKPQSDGVSITCLSNIQDKTEQVDLLLDAMGVLIHPE
jgi:predicted transcriptional regulator